LYSLCGFYLLLFAVHDSGGHDENHLVVKELRNTFTRSTPSTAVLQPVLDLWNSSENLSNTSENKFAPSLYG
jgi:hypothetical protein